MLNKSASAPTHNLPSEQVYGDIVKQIHSKINYLITTPLGSKKVSIASAIILQAISNGTVWYVAPSVSFTPFRVFSLKSTLANIDVSVMSVDKREIPHNRVVMWSAEVLSDYLPDLGGLPTPGLVIFDDAHYLGHPETGPVLEQILLCLPMNIPVLLLMSSVTNSKELSAWMETARRRPCRLMEIDLPYPPRIPAFISSHWDMVPLTDKKRLAGRVKRALKDKPTFHKVRSPGFIKQLVSHLREEDLIPAIILMPSEKDCDWAVNGCVQVINNAGKVLTEPQISTFLDRYSFLKDHPFLSIAVSKRVAPFHSGHHPLWCELVEHFLLYNNIDIIFTTIEAAVKMMVRVHTAVFCTSQQQHKEKFHEISQWEMNSIKRLAGREDIDNTGCIVVMHTPNTSAVLLKDLLLHTHSAVISTFRCDCQTVLSLLAQANDPEMALDRSLLSNQNFSEGGSRVEELLMELREELPKARCILSVRTIFSLINIHFRLSMRMNELVNKQKDSSFKCKENQLKEEQQALEVRLSQLPCKECAHFLLCHKRGSRKIRRFLDEYYEMQKWLPRSIIGLKLDFQYYLSCFQEFKWVDQEQHLTKNGFLALRTGLKFPYLLTECIREKFLPQDNPVLSFAWTGGFVEFSNTDLSQGMEFLQDYIREFTPVYEKMESLLIRTEERILRFGILAPRPDLYRSAMLLAYKKGENPETLSQNINISVGNIVGLLQKTTYLLERIGN